MSFLTGNSKHLRYAISFCFTIKLEKWTLKKIDIIDD